MSRLAVCSCVLLNLNRSIIIYLWHTQTHIHTHTPWQAASWVAERDATWQRRQHLEGIGCCCSDCGWCICAAAVLITRQRQSISSIRHVVCARPVTQCYSMENMEPWAVGAPKFNWLNSCRLNAAGNEPSAHAALQIAIN